MKTIEITYSGLLSSLAAGFAISKFYYDKSKEEIVTDMIWNVGCYVISEAAIQAVHPRRNPAIEIYQERLVQQKLRFVGIVNELEEFYNHPSMDSSSDHEETEELSRELIEQEASEASLQVDVPQVTQLRRSPRFR